MAQDMPSNGIQIVMFTHQSASVWADMAQIFWGAGLQVMAAWYIATETIAKELGRSSTGCGENAQFKHGLAGFDVIVDELINGGLVFHAVGTDIIFNFL